MVKKDTIGFSKFRDRTLVRSGDTIYYGDMTDPYVVKIDIKSKKKCNNKELPDDVTIKLLSTNTQLDDKKKLMKMTEKKGLYNALDISAAWLTRAIEVSEGNIAN